MRILLKFLLSFLGLVIFILVNQYLFCPQYSFPTHKSFSGAKIFNPYENVDSSDWRQCNFHAHVYAWSGLTNGKGTAQECWNIYDSLGYDVHCISDYEKVNDYGQEKKNFIPAYEHGYNFMKNHHGVLGTYHITFGDYVFPQTLSNKQHMLECLKKDSDAVIAINHPVLRNGFSPQDFKFIAGYDLIEVLRSTTHSFPQWDSALSSGHHAFIIADDDMHDSSRPNEVGRNCTWVNASSFSQTNILSSLKKGNAYGMILPYAENEMMHDKIQRFKQGFPKLNSVRIVDDTIIVSVSSIAQTFHFIGQGGKEAKKVVNDSIAKYSFVQKDTYIRAQIDFADGTSIFLNPVFWYDNANTDREYPVVNRFLSTIFWIVGVFVLAFYLLFSLRILRKKPSAKQSSRVG